MLTTVYKNASLRLATPPFIHLLVRVKSNNGSVAGEGNPRFPLSSLATCGKNSLHSTLFFYGLKKIKIFVPFRFRDRFTALFRANNQQITDHKAPFRSVLRANALRSIHLTLPVRFACPYHIMDILAETLRSRRANTVMTRPTCPFDGQIGQ